MSSELTFDLSKAQLTRAGAARLAGLPATTVGNWIDRDVIALGHPGTPTGRRFTGMDVIALALMGQLTRRCGLSPTAAAQVLPAMLERARQLIVTNPETDEFCAEMQSNGVEIATLVRLDNGRPADVPAPVNILSGLDAPPDDVRRGAYIVVPVDAIVTDALARIAAHLSAARAPHSAAVTSSGATTIQSA